MEIFKLQKKNKEIEALRKLASSLDLPVSAKAELKARVMKSVLETQQERVALSGAVAGKRQAWLPRFAFATIAGFAVLGGSVVASANSLPGDVLYPIKQVKEQVELQLAPQGQPKAMVMAKHAQNRLRELSDLKAAPADEIAKYQEEVRSQANVQVNNAIESLSRIKKKLEDEGKTQAAESVNNALNRLVADAKKENIQLKEEKEQERQLEGEKKEERKQNSQESKAETKKEKRAETNGLPAQNFVPITPTSSANSASSTLPGQNPSEGAVYGTSTQEQEKHQSEQWKQEQEK